MSNKDNEDDDINSDMSLTEEEDINEDEFESDLSLTEEEVAAENSDEEFSYEKDSSDDEEEVKMHNMFKLPPNLETLRNHPPDIKLKHTVIDLCFHPTEKLLASCSYTGECRIYRYDSKTTEKVSSLRHHKMSCRKICYSNDGSTLCSISEDKSFAFTDLNVAKPKLHMQNAHDSGISSVAQLDKNIWATGDEDGIVKIWDVRQQKPSFTFDSNAHETVVDFTIDVDNKYLVAAFENCSVLPIRLKNFKAKEETIGFHDHRCTSITVMNEHSANTLAVAGCDSGKLVLFTYGTFVLESFGLIHSTSVNCLLPYSNTKLITGSDDGKIRLAGVCPFKSYGVIGTTTTKAPILSLALSNTDDFMASSSADDKIQFWTTKKMEKIKSMKHNALHNKKKYRTNEKVFKSSRTRSVGQFLRDFKSRDRFKVKNLPAYSRDLE